MYDGIEGDTPKDIDYDLGSSSVSVKFSGFESALHGISSFVWAVETKPGLEDVQPFTEIGIYTSEEANDAGTGNSILLCCCDYMFTLIQLLFCCFFVIKNPNM